MKYTIEYCKNNKIAIKINSEEEYNKLLAYFDKQADYFENQNCVRFYGNVIRHAPESYFRNFTNYEIITFQEFMKNQAKKLEEFTNKEVIHCPTGELANKICELLNNNGFSWITGRLYIYDNNWEYYKENTCYSVKKGKYSDINYYKSEGYTIYKAEDILALYEKDNLEEYIVKCETKEETNIVASHIKEKVFDGTSVWKYVVNSKIFGKNKTLHNYIPHECKHLSVLTFKEFQQKIMNKTENIIGYKAPYDLAGGIVKKGTVYKKVQEDDRFYAPEDKISKTTLPKEIVETWEKVYEDEFKIGDWVYVIHNGGNCSSHNLHKKTYRKGEFFKISGFEISDINTKLAFTNQGGVLYIEAFKNAFRKATQEEIDSLFNKTLSLSNGKEVVIERAVIKPEGVEEIEVEELTNLIKNWVFKVNGYTTTVVDITFNIGCWKNVKLIDIQTILLEVERQRKLMEN